MKEEAKRRDHRLLLGKKLDLFSIQEDAGGGLVFWHPRGAMMRHIIEGYWVDKHINSATHPYELVGSPHIAPPARISNTRNLPLPLEDELQKEGRTAPSARNFGIRGGRIRREEGATRLGVAVRRGASPKAP